MDELGHTWDSEAWLLESVDASDGIFHEWGNLPEQVAFAFADPCLPSSTVHDDGDDIWQPQSNAFGTLSATCWLGPSDPNDLIQGELDYPAGPREPLLAVVGEPVDQPRRSHKDQREIPTSASRKQTKKSFVTKGTSSPYY